MFSTNHMNDRMSEKGHPEHIRSLASMPPRYTVHPEHIRSLASMPPRYTVHPEHKKSLLNKMSKLF
jgi:hypothetical protein